MYDLHRLGWNSFQELALTITREVLGQTVQSFLDANDGGRDGAFAGIWKPIVGEELTGKFVIQCKFTSRTDHKLSLSDCSDEIAKVERLVGQERCDSYVLMTNAGLSGKREEIIEAAFRSAGAQNVLILGSTWINQQIRESSRLRMLVPRVYGLGDLSQILDERAYLQARTILETMRDDLSRVVVTDAYLKAASALDEHGFVLLVGEPAAGKTTIASMLAMAATDRWNAAILKLDAPGAVTNHWNPDEPSQFFWLDDAFGVTQYESFLAHGWNHIFPHIRSMIGKGAKIVMTSRDYIYNRARNDLKEGAFPLLRESKVVIDVHDLSAEEKRQILYNHLKLGRQSRLFRAEIKTHLEAIATNERFVPETARRLADPLFTKHLRLDWYSLKTFVEKREDFLQEVLLGLDRHCKAALALIYMRNGRLESPISLHESEEQAVDRLGSNVGDAIKGLEALDGSLVTLSQASGDFLWTFKHPTIGDAYAAILARSNELLGIFLQGSSPEEFIKQVTCGDADIEKAVIIPSALYPQVLDKLDEFATSRTFKSPHLSIWHAKSALQEFLTHRCSKQFLELYVERHPKLVENVSKPGLYLSSVSEVGLAVQLHGCELLPEEHRLTFVKAVSNYAILGEDTYALADTGVRSVFTEEEFDELLRNVRIHLVPRLAEVRDQFQYNRDFDVSPEERMQPFFDSLDALATEFADDEDAMRVINLERAAAQDWVENSEPYEETRESRRYGTVSKPDGPSNTRSIFEDIDD